MMQKTWLGATGALAALLLSGAFALPAQAAEPAAATVIGCNVSVQNAHGSTHVTGTINVVSTVSCTAPVTSLRQQTALYKVGAGSWWGTAVTKAGVSSIQSNAATSCSAAPGQFYGAAVTSIVWPPGYTGTTGGDNYGNTTSVNCSTAQIASPLGTAPDGGKIVAVFTATKTN